MLVRAKMNKYAYNYKVSNFCRKIAIYNMCIVTKITALPECRLSNQMIYCDMLYIVSR